MRSSHAASICRKAHRLPLAARARLAYHVRRITDHPSASSWDELAAVLLAHAVNVVSIDVFDTVVFRSVVGDVNVERIVCDRVAALGLWSGTGSALFEARQAQKQDQPHASSHDWFAAIGLTDPAAAVSVETDIEVELCRGVPGAAEGLQRLRSGGKRIVFLSDMHLPAAALRRILENVGVLHDVDHVVASSDHGATKGNGGLYDVLADHLEAEDFVHAGNSRWIDVAMCEATGRPSVFFSGANPTRYETTFAAAGVLGGLLAGASRTVRLDESIGDERDKVLVEIGTGVAGQALAAFTLWIRARCLAAEITKVAYCARDGELPMRMAEVLPEQLKWATREVYLHGNRRSWLVAGAATLGLPTWMSVATADENALLRYGIHAKPLASSLGRLALSAEEIPDDLRAAQLDPAQPLPPGDADAWTELYSDTRIQQHVVTSGSALAEDLADYLTTLGIDSGKWALVDVGWRGQLAAMMSAMFDDHVGSVPLHLHFGARGAHPVTEALLEVERFAFDGVERQPPCANIVSAVETITGSGGVRAVAFARADDGRVEPVLSEPIEAIDTAERQRVWEVATKLAAALPCTESLRGYYDEVESLCDAAGEVFRSYWLEPTSEEAEVLGSFCFELDEDGEVIIPIVAPYELTGLFRKDLVAPRQWRNGSLAVTPQPLRTALRFGDRLQRLVHGETRG